MKTRKFLVHGFPFIKKHLLFVTFVFGLISLTLNVYVQAFSIDASCAECKSISCGDKVAYDSDGYVKGCEEKLIGDDCTGNCHKCTGSTTDYHCEHTGDEDDTCYSDTGMPSTSCGTKTYYPCEGDHHPDCTCNTSGEGTCSDDSCSIKTCA